jgi:pimeloyl-ACP methyl ester carboxylesterase
MATLPHPRVFLILTLIFAVSILASCASEGEEIESDPVFEGTSNSVTGIRTGGSEETGCDSTRTPIVYVYGILENGESFSNQVMRFGSNGYCLDRIFAFDWNGFRSYRLQIPLLDAFIDQVLAETSASKVDLVVHSLGAGVGTEYLKSELGENKLAHYVQIAALPCEDAQTNIPALNLASATDRVIGMCRVDKFENREILGTDHLQTITSPSTFFEIFRFLNDEKLPATTQILPEETILLSGKTVTYAINEPVEGTIVQVYEFDPATGERLRDTPDGQYVSEIDGAWGPFEAEPGAYYELVVIDANGDWPPLHFYREPFIRSNNMTYMRVYPDPDSAMAAIFNLTTQDDSVAGFSWIALNQALIYGRDTLTVNGIELSTPDVAPAAETTINIMFGDLNGNGISDNVLIGSMLPNHFYMKLFDLRIETEPRAPIVFNFNGRTMAIPNWKADSEGVSTAVFE